MNECSLSSLLQESRKHSWKFALSNPNIQNFFSAVGVCCEIYSLSLSPSSRAVPEQPERPDCQLHGDRTQAPGAGGEALLCPGEGEHAEVHDPDEAPSRGRSGMKLNTDL